jgi:hypothetical protein
MTRVLKQTCVRFLVAVAFVASTATARADEPREIARIIIEGNTDTPAYFIERLVRIRTGDKIRETDLRAAEERLRACKLFQLGPGLAPSVTLIPNDLDEKLFDLRIRIAEQPWNGVMWGIAEIRAALYARDLNAILRAMIFLKGGLERLQSWREAERR